MKRMKNKYMVLVWALGFVALTGCDSFLDVNPKGTVEQGKQFEDIQGYRDAMYGIYASMSNQGLYGKSLSWGLVDWLAQLAFEKYGNEGRLEVAAANQYLYKDQSLSPVIDNVWEKAFECISYANNVLENIEHEDISRDGDYALIKGEAYGIRAFLHFDMIRLFAENIIRNPEAGGIPYAYTFDLANKNVYSLKESYDNVLADLKKAEACLVDDNEMNPKEAASEYRKTRGMHCNKYAVWALKARVFHYKGDLDSAAFYAGKVVNSPEFALVDKGLYITKDMKRYPYSTNASSEMIWGLYTNRLYDDYLKLFLNGSVASAAVIGVREDVESIYEKPAFDADSKDMRFEAFFAVDDGMWDRTYNFIRLLKKDEKANVFQGICLIRLPEMYYILAEATYDKDQAKALRFFNDVRNSRGLRDIDPARVNSREKFQKELVAERCKEFWGEGQTFFSYKRENMSITNGSLEIVFQPSSAIYVLPWPQKEQEFGGINK